MKPGDLFIEKYRMGEMSEQEKADFEASFDDPEILRKKIEELEASDGEILNDFPADRMAASILDKLNAEQSGTVEADPIEGDSAEKAKTKNIRVFNIVRFAGLAAAAALVLAFGLNYNTGGKVTSGNLAAATDIQSAERVKGTEPTLRIYRNAGDSAEVLQNRDIAFASDLLQIEYISGSFRNGVIFSIDGRGTVTMHQPTYDSMPADLEQGGAVLLPYAYELDDAPDFERFFFITGGSGFDMDEVLDAAYELASDRGAARRELLELPDTYFQTTILLKKGVRR